jgi:hypothetical protein
VGCLDVSVRGLNNGQEPNDFPARPPAARGPSPRPVPMLSPRVLPFALLFVAAASAVGCGGGEGIKSYTVARQAEPTAKEVAGPYRLLGAMVPAEDPMWFFKLSGPTDALTKYEGGFDQLVSSIRLKGDDLPPDFTVPEGWKLGGPRPGFVPVAQTVKLPDPALEVTVVKSGGGVVANLDRWVGQLGHKASPSDLARFTKAVDAAGGKVLRVDIRGPKNPNAGGGPMMGKVR